MGTCLSTDAAAGGTAAKAPAAAAAVGGGGGLLKSDSLRALSRRWSGRGRKKKAAAAGGGREAGGRGGVDLSSLSKGGSFSDDELQRIPGRMFANGSSSVACLYTQQGKKGANQDAMIVWENFAARSDTIFCGVFDGHGPFGHLVARRVRDSLPIKIFSQWGSNTSDHGGMHETSSCNGSMNSEDTASINLEDESLDVEENEKLPDVFLTLKQCFLKTFRLMDKELKLHPTIDCFCSGTTAVTLVKQGLDLVIGNVGDSRAVLGTRDKDNLLVAVQLTVDLKPNLPREAARIQQCKGRVFALLDEPEVARVWLPNNDSPGLAMARAFGDFCLKDFGLISVPDVSYRRITSKDEFVVLATDGVWDVLSNKEVVDIVASAPNRGTAARALVECAVRAWRLKFPTSKSDDCAVVCLFFDHPSSSDEDQHTILDIAKDEPHTRVLDSDVTKAVHDIPLETAAVDEWAVKTSGLDEIVPACEQTEAKAPERSQSTRSLAECIFSPEDEEWSALEGVTRVNSLVNLPRFAPGDRKSSTWRKWL